MTVSMISEDASSLVEDCERVSLSSSASGILLSDFLSKHPLSTFVRCGHR